MQFTEQQISIVARSLSDSSSLVCQVDKDDNWKCYGQMFIDEARSALAALSASAPADCSGTPASCPDNEGYGCACSAAAPQVVADERKGSPYPEYDRGFSNGWDACAKRAAAPVQPVPDAMEVPEPDYSGPVLTNEAEIAHAEGWNACRDAMLKVNPIAPVQPVAVPDGWKLDLRATHYTLFQGNTVVANLAGPDAKENAAVIARMLAAPAAQGDAIPMVDDVLSVLNSAYTALDSLGIGKTTRTFAMSEIVRIRVAIAAKAAS